MNLGLLGNSLLLVGLTTALGLAWALPYALALQVVGTRWRTVLLAGALATLALPGFFVAGIWMEWVGFAGAWRVGTGGWTERWLPLICSAWVLSLLFWPIPALLIGGAWGRWDGRVLEVWPELRGARLLGAVHWPVARGALGLPVAVMAILVLGQFSVPALFQARVWPAEVWVEYSTRFDEWAAVTRSVGPGLVMLGLVLWLRGRTPVWPAGGRGGVEPTFLRRRLGPWWSLGCVATAMLLLGVALALPVGAALADRRTWTELMPAAEAAWPAVGRSFGYAAGTATCVMLAGAWLTGRRWAAASILPLIFPGVLVGIALARVFALPGVVLIRGSAAVVVLALSVRYLFIGWYAAERSWRGLEPAFRDLARLEGMGWWTRWRHLAWPMRGATLRGAWLVAYLLCLWDIETLILVVPPGGDSLALMIFNLLHYGHNAQVTALCLLLGGLALLPVLFGGAVSLALRKGDGSSGFPGRNPGASPRLNDPEPLRTESGASTVAGRDAPRSGRCRSTESSRGASARLTDREPRCPRRGCSREEAKGRRGQTGSARGFLFASFAASRAILREGPLTGSEGPPVNPRREGWNELRGRGSARGAPQWWTSTGSIRAGCVSLLLVIMMVDAGCSPEATETSAPLASALFERVEVIGDRGTGPGHFNKPRSVAVDGEDNLFVVDMTGRVQKFDRAGRWLRQWQMPETVKGKAKGMDASPDGGVLVVEPHYNRINRFTPDGELTAQWGTRGTNAGELWFPRAIAVGREGDCWVSEYGVVERVQHFRVADGTYLGGLGTPGTAPGQLNRVEGLDVAPDGSVVVADSCNHRVQVFSADGKLLRTHGGPGRGTGQFSYPYDVRVDSEGRQYVCEFGNSRVQVFDAADRPLETLGGAGRAPGQMNNPWSLCLDSSGNLYVADAQNHRVLKFVRRGTRGS